MLLVFCITTMFLIASFSATDTCGRYYSQAGTYCGATTFTHSNVEDPIVHMSICKTCGFPNYFSHSFSWDSDTLCHWQECDDCVYSKDLAFHTYGSQMSITVGTHTRFCSVCDYSKVDDHAISSWTITTMSHTGTCSVCNYTVFESHSFKTEPVRNAEYPNQQSTA